MHIKNIRKLTISIRIKNEGEWKDENGWKRCGCKREREREQYSKEISFICDAEKAYDFVIEKDNKIDVHKKDRLSYSRESRMILLYDSLSFL